MDESWTPNAGFDQLEYSRNKSVSNGQGLLDFALYNVTMDTGADLFALASPSIPSSCSNSTGGAYPYCPPSSLYSPSGPSMFRATSSASTASRASSDSQISTDSGYYSIDDTPATSMTCSEIPDLYHSGDATCTEFSFPGLLHSSPESVSVFNGAMMGTISEPCFDRRSSAGINAPPAAVEGYAYPFNEYLSSPFCSAQGYLQNEQQYSGFVDPVHDSPQWFGTQSPDSGYSSGGSSWASPATFMGTAKALHEAQIAVKQLSALNAKLQEPKAKKTYTCPIVSCKRGFVRMSNYKNHLKSKHPEYSSVRNKTSLSTFWSARSSPSMLALQLDNDALEELIPIPNSPLPTCQGTSSPGAAIKQTSGKTEVVSEWLENVPENDEATTDDLALKYIESQQSIVSISTPCTVPLFRSCSGVSDSPWFESEGEASFVLGETPTSTTPPNESGSYAAAKSFLAQDLVRRYLTQASNAGDGTDNSSQSSSASDTSGQSNPTTNATSITTPPSTIKSTHKRPFQEDEEEGARRNKLPCISDESQGGPESKLLACPYSKFDPQRYSERNEREKNYRGCSSCFLKDVARLKQHLYRVHRRPEHHCPTCFASFKTRELLDGHIVERSCQQQASPFEEKMTPDQLTMIKRRGMNRRASDAWFDIYKVLFPDSPLPLNPYNDGVHAVTLQDFISFLDRDGRAILSSEINRRMFPPMIMDTQESRDNLAFRESVFDDAVNVLLQRLDSRFRQTQPQSPDDGAASIFD